MSFLQLCRILWARRSIIIAATLGCFLAALAAALLLPARYQSSSRVLLELIKPDPVTGQIISTTSTRAYVATQVEIIGDYRTTGQVVDDLGWTTSPDLLENYNESGRSGAIDFRRWLAQTVSENVTVNSVEGSNVLEITYSSNNPETSRVVADAIRKAYVDQSLSFRRASATDTAQFFTRQLETLRGELGAAEARKSAFERANRIVLQDDNSDTESARLKAMSNAAATPPPSIATGGPSPAALALAQLDARIATEAQSLGPNHPVIQDLRRQRGALAAAAAQERSAGSVSAGPSIAGQVSRQESLVMAQRDKVEEARRLQADLTALRDQYAKTAARAADLRQQAESTETGLTLLGSAVAAQKPSSPNVPLIIVGSLLFGAGLGVLAALITELLSRRVRGVEDLAGSGAPVIIVIGGWSGRPAADRPLLKRLGLRRSETA